MLPIYISTSYDDCGPFPCLRMPVRPSRPASCKGRLQGVGIFACLADVQDYEGVSYCFYLIFSRSFIMLHKSYMCMFCASLDRFVLVAGQEVSCRSLCHCFFCFNASHHHE